MATDSRTQSEPQVRSSELVRHDVVNRLVERANAAQGLAADYLACIAGMWADTLHVLNPETKPDGERRQSWFSTGIAASKTARTRHA